MNVYIIAGLAVLVVLLLRLTARLHVELYAQRTVSAVYRAIEQLAFEQAGEDGVMWLKGETAYAIKMHYVYNAYRRMPARVGFAPAWLIRALYTEQKFMDLVEYQYEQAVRLAEDALDKKESLSIDFD